MKTAAYTFWAINWRRRKPKFKPNYQKPTEYLFGLAKKQDLHFILTDFRSFQDSYFKNSWLFDGKKWNKSGKFKPDVIYDKSKTDFEKISIKLAVAEKIPIVNNPIFDLICENKFLSYLYFKKYSPETFILNRKNLNKILKEIKTKLIVTKPIWGSGGKDVKIIPHQNLKQIKKGQIVQEFIDSSQGIKKIVKGAHDLRIVIIDGEISYSYLRIPKRGTLIANIQQGGKMTNLENFQIPSAAKKIAKEVDKQFQDFLPRIYTIDLIFDKQQKPWLLELNSKPGIYFYPQDKNLQTKFYTDIIVSLKSFIK